MNFITGLTDDRQRSYLAHMEPGKPAVERLSFAVSNEDQALITKLKHHLEAKGNCRLSVSEVIRQGVKCLAEREGIK